MAKRVSHANGSREPRSRWVSLRVSERELAALRGTARTESQSLSDVIRRDGIEAVAGALERPKNKTRRRKRSRVKT